MAFVRPLWAPWRGLARRVHRFVLAIVALLGGSGCLSQSYEVSAPELARLVDRPPAERGERVRVTQQTSFGNDLRDTTLPDSDADVALLLASSYDSSGLARHRRRSRDASESDAGDSPTEDALEAAVVVVATAATAAITLGITEGARFDGWVRVPEQHPVLLVDRRGQRRWKRLGLLAPADLRELDHALLADFSEDLERLERHPLERTGFVYQLELGAEPAALAGSSLAVAGRGGVGYMPSQRYGFLLGAAFSSARHAAPNAASGGAAQSFDQRVFLQTEAWLLSAARWHVGPYAELGYAWALADDPRGSHAASGPMLALGGALQLDWTTRLALMLRAGIAALPEAESRGSPRASGAYRFAPALTVGVGIY